MERLAPQRRERDEDDVVQLADRLDRLARWCRAQSLKPVAIAARVAAESARSLAADEANAVANDANVVEVRHRAAVDAAARAADAAAAAAAASWRAAQAAAAEAEAERALKLRRNKATASADVAIVTLKQRCAELEAIVDGPENDAAHQHALDFAPAAMRIFRFASDSAPRVLELAHVSAFLRECAVEFGSVDAALPGALRCEGVVGRYLAMRKIACRKSAHCPWLAAKLLSCRSGAPMPAAALAPDVTRHDVNWGAEGARRHKKLVVSSDGSALSHSQQYGFAWAQGAVGVRSGKHLFSVTVTRINHGYVKVGWVDRALRTDQDERDDNGPGYKDSLASGATLMLNGCICFGTAPLSRDQRMQVPSVNCPCTVGCLLDADVGAMTVFVDGEPLAQQCEYKFPTDREWYPSVSLWNKDDALHSNAV
jgi:hypothetical protein